MLGFGIRWMFIDTHTHTYSMMLAHDHVHDTMMLKNKNRKHRKMVLTWKFVSVEYKPSKCTDAKKNKWGKNNIILNKQHINCVENYFSNKRYIRGKIRKRQEKKNFGSHKYENKLCVKDNTLDSTFYFWINTIFFFHVDIHTLHILAHELWILKYMCVCVYFTHIQNKKDTCDYFMWTRESSVLTETGR